MTGMAGNVFRFRQSEVKGNESFISCCRIDLDGGFVLDVPEKCGQQIMVGRLYSVPDRDARFWGLVFVGACQ